MRNLLVTGGAGFIGTNFVNYWLKHHPQDRIVVIDALTYAGNIANLKPLMHLPNFRFAHINLNQYDLLKHLISSENIDTIVHFAAESHVDRSITGPDIFLETNIIGTHQLLKVARKVWLEKKSQQNYRFHHISTDEVYGSLQLADPAFTESTPYAPNSPYAASKAASDHLVRAYYHTYGLPVTISNCSNNYGPYQFPEKLIPLLITNALQGKALPIYGDGKNIRDWLYVEDHCRGIELILEKGELGEVYNIGVNNEQNNNQVVHFLCEIVDRLFQENNTLVNQFPHCPAAMQRSTKSLIQFVADRPGHDQRYAINAEKIIHQLGFVPKEDFISGLKKTVNWYLANANWWHSLSTIKGSQSAIL